MHNPPFPHHGVLCCAALGPVSLAAHTIVKQVIDFAMAIFGCFSTVAQSLVATCLGKVNILRIHLPRYAASPLMSKKCSMLGVAHVVFYSVQIAAVIR